MSHNFISLYRKNGISVTPLNCALKALTFCVEGFGICIGCSIDKEIEYGIIMSLKGVNHRIKVIGANVIG